MVVRGHDASIPRFGATDALPAVTPKDSKKLGAIASSPGSAKGAATSAKLKQTAHKANIGSKQLIGASEGPVASPTLVATGRPKGPVVPHRPPHRPSSTSLPAYQFSRGAMKQLGKDLKAGPPLSGTATTPATKPKEDLPKPIMDSSAKTSVSLKQSPEEHELSKMSRDMFLPSMKSNMVNLVDFLDGKVHANNKENRSNAIKGYIEALNNNIKIINTVLESKGINIENLDKRNKSDLITALKRFKNIKLLNYESGLIKKTHDLEKTEKKLKEMEYTIRDLSKFLCDVDEKNPTTRGLSNAISTVIPTVLSDKVTKFEEKIDVQPLLKLADKFLTVEGLNKDVFISTKKEIENISKAFENRYNSGNSDSSMKELKKSCAEIHNSLTLLKTNLKNDEFSQPATMFLNFLDTTVTKQMEKIAS